MQPIQPRRFHPWKTVWVLAVLVAFFLLIARRDPPGPRNPDWSGGTMGTLYRVRLADSPLTGPQLQALKAEIEALLSEINRQMSHYDPDSELSRFNDSDSTAPFQVSAPFAQVVRFALDLHRRSDGAFDPALGPLIDRWGFGPDGRPASPPAEEEIARLLAITGCRHLRVTDGDELQKDIPGLRLDLGAVAKGFGADEVARLILARGVGNLFVEIGGEVTAFGRNPQGQRWKVGIETPSPLLDPGESIEAVVEISRNAIATSGDYRNYVEDDLGRRHSHILDPRIGKPVRHNLASVSVVAADCMTADGLATALFVMGVEEGSRLIEEWPEAEALFLVRDPDGSFSPVMSSGFAEVAGCRLSPR